MNEKRLTPSGSVWSRRVLGALLVAVLIYLGRQYFTELERLRDADWLTVAVMVVVLLATSYAEAELTCRGLARLGHPIGRVESVQLGFVRSYTNLLVPRAGFGVTALYLNRVRGVPVARFGSLLLPLLVLSIVPTGVVGLGAAVILSAVGRPPSWQLVGVFLAAASAGLLLGFPRLLARFASGRARAWLAGFVDAWEQLARHREFLGWAVALQLLMLVLRVARVYLSFVALGLSPTLSGVLFVSLAADLTMVISLTPAALGFREAFIVYTAQLTGIEPALALAAALLDRVVVTVVLLIAGQLSAWALVIPDQLPDAGGAGGD